MEILGYLSSALIGLSLGLLGAGGSILTLPVLVYLFRIEPVAAVRYSLFVVGITSLVACIPRIKKGEVLFIQGSLFALISIIIVYLTRTWLIPFMPHDIFQSGNLVVSFGAASMIAFAILMLLASRMMIRSPKQQITANKSPSELILFAVAIVTGILTGLLGAGGGFLIVPALMIFYRLDAKKAVGTSLFIITLNALAGFVSELDLDIQWTLLLKVTLLALLGSLIGQRVSAHLDTKRLRESFGWFILIMALIIITTQSFQIFNGRQHQPHHNKTQ